MKLKNLWLNESNGRMEICAYFSNDRFHAAMIDVPYGKDEVACALHAMAENIARDYKLCQTVESPQTGVMLRK